MKTKLYTQTATLPFCGYLLARYPSLSPLIGINSFGLTCFCGTRNKASLGFRYFSVFPGPIDIPDNYTNVLLTGKEAVHLGYIYDELLSVLGASEVDETKANNNIIYRGSMSRLENTSDWSTKRSIDPNTFVWNTSQFVFQFGRREVIRFSRHIGYMIE